MRWTIDMGYSRFPDAPLDPPEQPTGDDEQDEDTEQDEA